MSAGIPAKLGPHPARKNQGVPKCPEENSGRKSIQYSTCLHYKASIFYSRIIKALSQLLSEEFDKREPGRSLPYVLYSNISVKFTIKENVTSSCTFQNKVSMAEQSLFQ